MTLCFCVVGPSIGRWQQKQISESRKIYRKESNLPACITSFQIKAGGA